MRGSTQDFSPTGNRVLILDSGAIFAGTPLASFYKSKTTPSVIEEVRDPDSRRTLEMLIASGRLNIEEPPLDALRQVERTAARLGLTNKLSKTDLDVAALALHYRCKGLDALVATDDYTLQLLLEKLDIRWVKVRYRGLYRGLKRHG